MRDLAGHLEHCSINTATLGHRQPIGAARRLLALHVNDWRVPTRGLLLDRAMMGDGVIELAALRAMVADAGYRGAVEVEFFSRDDWWQRDAAETLAVAVERLQSLC
jgi:sugar phosphate isomerase/epimerase